MSRSKLGYRSGYGKFPVRDDLISYMSVFLIGLSFGITLYYVKTSEDKIATTIMKRPTPLIIPTPDGYVVCDGTECRETR